MMAAGGAGGADEATPVRPPPVVPRWPGSEPLPGHDVVLARPRMEDAPATLAMQADGRLWVDVPPEWRVTSLEAQQDDLRRFLGHWREHGFGYWLAWPGAAAPAVDDGRRPLAIGGLRWMWWRDAWVLNVYVRVAVDTQGRGLASAMLGLAIDRLDGVVPSPTSVVVRTRDANAGMIAVARRLGMADIGHEEREMGRYRVFERHIGGAA